MSSRGKINVAGILLTLAVVAFYAVLQWQANPLLTSAAGPSISPSPEAAPTGNPPPDDDDATSGGCSTCGNAAIVFVLDSSVHMFPRVGANYFDMAKEAIVHFIDRPGFSKSGAYRIGVVQFTELNAPGYNEFDQWLSPWRVVDKESAIALKLNVAALARSTHHSSSLMEVGIREATMLLDAEFVGHGQKHIIILTTGEYRLPPPCPPTCYSRDTETDCWGQPSGSDCDDATHYSCAIDATTDYFCKRACPIRYFADAARANGITVSTVRVGVDWRNRDLEYCPEELHPYGLAPDYCLNPNQPHRAGFLQEIANVGDCSNDGLRVGKYARINPTVSFGCASGDCEPGTAEDISDAMAEWMCDWFPGLATGESVPRFCDNCVTVANPRQRDCDGNGLGNICQWPTLTQCGANTEDLDCDGVPNDDDLCPGGDDCLFLEWTNDLECDFSLDPNECGPDCDHDGVSDPCQAAKEIHKVAEEANKTQLDLPDTTSWALADYWNIIDADVDGVIDCCAAPRGICNGATVMRPECEPTDCAAVDCDVSPECCDPNDDHCDCDPIPVLCDTPDIVTAPFSNGEMLEDFADSSSTPIGAFFPTTDANDAGWWVSTDSTAAILPVNVIDDPTNGFRFLQIGVDEGGANSMPTDGTASWYIEGPGYDIPLGKCFPSVCNNAAWRHPWGAYAVEFSLRINNASNEFVDGSTYELLIVDPYEEDTQKSQRVHLRFRPDLEDLNGWKIESGYRAYNAFGLPVTEFEEFPSNDYEQNKWFRLKIAMNVSRGYDAIPDYGCVWNGNRDTIHIFRDKIGTPLDPPDYPEYSRREELGRIVPEVPRGVQIQIRTNNKLSPNLGPSTFDVADIRIYPISWCEWNRRQGACPPDLNCRCGWELGTNTWFCVPDTCGNDVLNGWETCDPPDGESCDSGCRWICGDGIIQADDVDVIPAGGNGDIDLCEFAEPPGDDCTVRNEECDPPFKDLGFSDGWHNYCMADCTIFQYVPCLPGGRCLPPGCASLCGDGVVQGFCEEECDDGGYQWQLPGDPCDDCTDDCIARSCVPS